MLQVLVDRPGRKPCCSSIRIELTAGPIDFKTNESNNLAIYPNKEIGR